MRGKAALRRSTILRMVTLTRSARGDLLEEKRGDDASGTTSAKKAASRRIVALDLIERLRCPVAGWPNRPPTTF